MTTFAKLYQDRCYETADRQIVPHFWNPQPVELVPHSLFADDDDVCEEHWGVDIAVHKVLALALQLEMPVGAWIGDFTLKETLRIPDEAIPLLKSNIKDETFHDKGFRLAAEVYPINPVLYQQAEYIGSLWLENSATTLQKACFAETGVFLCSLAILRLAGGKHLAKLAEQVSRDEARHVATNRGLLEALGDSCTVLPSALKKLVPDTVAWISESLNIPGSAICEDFDFNQKFLLASSKELIEEGTAQRLDSLMNYATHTLPFEVSNKSLYSRAAA